MQQAFEGMRPFHGAEVFAHISSQGDQVRLGCAGLHNDGIHALGADVPQRINAPVTVLNAVLRRLAIRDSFQNHRGILTACLETRH